LLSEALDDQAGWVRVAAAAGLDRYEQYGRAVPVLRAAMGDANPWIRHQASEALDRIDKHALPAVAEMQRGLMDDNDYVVRVVTHALEELGEKPPPRAAKGKNAGKNKAKGKNRAK
jgi:HEAT repeat protein